MVNLVNNLAVQHRKGLLKAGRADARILIVDDEVINRMVLSRMLRQRGFEVVEADNGRSAIKLLIN